MSIQAQYAAVLARKNASGGAPSYLLDTYTGVAAAYSVRKLATGQTYSMKVREDGGDTLLDIGFSGEDLDEAAIASHCGANNGFVETLYDPSGNSLDISQLTNGAQPKIYDGSAVIKTNGKPAIDFTPNQEFPPKSFTLTQPFTWFCVADQDNTGDVIIDGYTNTNYGSLYGYTSGGMRFNCGTPLNTGAAYTHGDQILIFAMGNGTNSDIGINGGTPANGNAGTRDPGGLTIAQGGGGSFNHNGRIQEILAWNSDKTSDRSGIESNINSYFSIY